MELTERKDIIALEDGGCIAQKTGSATINAVDDGDIVAMVSTPSVDSYGDIVHQGPNDKGAGWLLSRFNNAPVMLWSHNMFQMNISGPATRASVRPHSEFGEALFLDPVQFDLEDEDAAKLEGKIRRKVIKENSVGFTSDNWRYMRDDEDRYAGIEFFEQELLELSWANRGANPDTTTMFKSMISMHSDLAQRIDARDSQRAVEDKADLLDAIEQVADRVRTLEGLATEQAKMIESLRDEKAAQAVLIAKQERENQIDALLRSLGKKD